MRNNSRKPVGLGTCRQLISENSFSELGFAFDIPSPTGFFLLIFGVGQA